LFFAEATDILAHASDKLPDNSPVDALSLTLESIKLIQALLHKNKGVMSKMHSMIFPKADQNKTLDQRRLSRYSNVLSHTYDALLVFQIMRGHGFKDDIEQMSKELPKEQDGQLIDLSGHKASMLKCARQLLELVSANKSATGPSLSTQTQAP
jgi:hypothetical protein